MVKEMSNKNNELKPIQLSPEEREYLLFEIEAHIIDLKDNIKVEQEYAEYNGVSATLEFFEQQAAMISELYRKISQCNANESETNEDTE